MIAKIPNSIPKIVKRLKPFPALIIKLNQGNAVLVDFFSNSPGIPLSQVKLKVGQHVDLYDLKTLKPLPEGDHIIVWRMEPKERSEVEVLNLNIPQGVIIEKGDYAFDNLQHKRVFKSSGKAITIKAVNSDKFLLEKQNSALRISSVI
jgi:hypothetical protein